jgi:hypothetical protein
MRTSLVLILVVVLAMLGQARGGTPPEVKPFSGAAVTAVPARSIAAFVTQSRLAKVADEPAVGEPAKVTDTAAADSAASNSGAAAAAPAVPQLAELRAPRRARPRASAVPAPRVPAHLGSYGLAFALATNLPVVGTHSLAASAYLGLNRHHVLRANIAAYDNFQWSFDSEASVSGDFFDLGVGWAWYQRRRWDGFSVEVGPLLRLRDTRVLDSNAAAWDQATRSTYYAMRGMLGWSWRIFDVAFVSVGVGMSSGYESGTLTTKDIYNQTRIRRVKRSSGDAEGYLRFGLTFGD